MSDEKKGNRLPPPAFPPGSRRHAGTNNSSAAPESGGGDGFISPDDPMPARSDAVGDAFISPDDPMPDRPGDEAAYISPDEPIPHRDPLADKDGVPQFESDAEGGVVTGMGHDAHMDPEELVAGGDPYVMDLVGKVGTLAEALRSRGEAGLRTTPEMDKFEATLRGYCVGYLAGRRAVDEASSEDY